MARRIREPQEHHPLLSHEDTLPHYSSQGSSEEAMEEADRKSDKDEVQAKKKRVSEKFTWDYCMVFKRLKEDDDSTIKVKRVKVSKTEHFAKETSKVIKALEDAGLRTTQYLSVQEDEVYCLIGATDDRLKKEAHRISHDLLLDKDKSLVEGIYRGVGLAVQTVDVDSPEARLCKRDAWENLYCQYDEDPKAARIYQTYSTEGPMHKATIFKTTDRLKLIISIIEVDALIGGAGLAVGKLIKKNKKHPLIACFPLHQHQKKISLERHWSLFNQPLNGIRDYFGEYFALYFAFLSFYSKWLIFPASLGLVFFILQLVFNAGHPDVRGIWVLGLAVSFWTPFFLEFWKRREAALRVRWGQTHFLDKEQNRPEFEGEWIYSPIDGTLTEYYPWYKKLCRTFFSQTVIYTMIGIVISCVFGIFLLRKKWSNENLDYGPYLVGVINAVQIVILNAIYSKTAEKLTRQENHRTDSQFENALIAKSFLFKFVNSYNTLFYIAFIKKYDVGCPDEEGNLIVRPLEEGQRDGDCLAELQIQLGTIFISMIIINNSIEWIVPKIMSSLEARKQGKSISDLVKKTDPELQYELTEYDSTFSDYDELIVQFGYVTLFLMAFPLTPLLAVVNNVIEVWLDSRKLTRNMRRPEPRGVYNIGTWRAILEILSVLTVLTNVGLAVFETSVMGRLGGLDWEEGEEYSVIYKVWVFFLVEHFIMVTKFLIQYFIPDQSDATTVHIQRQEYVAKSLIHQIKADAEYNKSAVIPEIESESFNYNLLSVGYKKSKRHWA